MHFLSANVTESTTTVVEVVTIFAMSAFEVLFLVDEAICEN